LDAAWPRPPNSKSLTTVPYNPILLKAVETPPLNSPQFSPFIHSGAVTIASHVKLKARFGIVLSDNALLCPFSTFSEETE
jgi:hypothetical protein